MNVDRKELLRYIGGGEPDEAMNARIDEAIAAATAAAQPRSCFRRFSYDGKTLGGVYDPESRDVAELLRGCKEAFLFAATLGGGIERETEKAFARGSLGALLTDAAASCLIESYCDEECERIAKEENVTLTLRFSCGYGDYPLTHQREVCRLLDAQRRIGLYVGEDSLLMPRKSVTAIMGVIAQGYSPTDRRGHTADKCAKCAALSCPYRRSPASYPEENK